MRLLFLKCLLLCSLICDNLLSYAQDTMILDSVFRQSVLLREHYYGVNLYDLDSSRTIYSHRADQYFTPASNTKVYTLYSTLQVIGDSIPGLQYVERGDSLIFWGTGDPTFLHPKLNSGKVYDFLKNSGKHLFYRPQENPDGPFRHGWTMEDYNYSYQRDIVPFPIYGNLVHFNAEKGVLKVSPRHFEKKVTPLKRRKGNFSIRRNIGDNVFELSGNAIPQRYAADKPFVWSDTLFVRLLADTLRLSVHILQDEADISYEGVRTLYSTSRNTVLREMMLPSDNFLAEQLTMVAAYSKFNSFLTDSLRKEMEKLHFSVLAGEAHLWDGSGLSVYNKITPENMTALLVALSGQVVDEYALRMFFPAGGVDGTLKNTYRIDRSGPFVWAKTGTLRSVYCQSGYLQTKSGRRLAFSFLNNNFVGSAGPIRREVARIMTYIHDNF